MVTKRANCDVLVVGTGPTGLALAMQLTLQGVDVVIIDKASARSSTSKAIGVQAGTLELLEAVFGKALSEQMIEAGVPAQRIEFNIEGKSSFVVDASLVPSKYNFLLMLAQYETERIFEEWLEDRPVKVLREHELESFTMNDSEVISRIKLSDGQISEIKSKYIIGCDGAHSKVREQLGLDFSGGTYEGFFLLADLRVGWPYETYSVRGFMGENGSAIFFPLKGENFYRLFIVPNHLPEITSTGISFEELVAESRKYLPTNIQISEPRWISGFRIHHRVASKFRVERAFLVGDAAHIHSPVGAQGMNVGIHEAISLGYKLKLVIKDHKSPTFLDSYEKERRPIALAVVRVTDFMFRMINSRNGVFAKLFRRIILPNTLGNRFVQKYMMGVISEVKQAREQILQDY